MENRYKILLLLVICVSLMLTSCNQYDTKGYKNFGLNNSNFDLSIPNSFIYVGADTFNFYGNYYLLSVFADTLKGKNDTFQIRYYDKYEAFITDSVMSENFPTYVKNQKTIRSYDTWLTSSDTIIKDRKFFVLDSYRSLDNDTIYYYGEFSTVYNDSLYSFIYKSKCQKDRLNRSTPFNILSTLSFEK